MSKKGVIIAIIIAVGIAWIGMSTPKNPPTQNQNTLTNQQEPMTEAQNPFTSRPTHMATMQTSAGEIKIALYADKAPKTVENFANLANDEFYNDTRFHRIIEGFMIQGGDPNTKGGENKGSFEPGTAWGTGGPGYQFEDEIHTENQNLVGTIAMANAGPGTNGSQFFINVDDNGYLNSRHTVFGVVSGGMDVVMALSGVATDGGDRPVEDVVLESVIVEEVTS